MEYVVILIVCIIVALIAKIALNVKIKDFKKIKEIGYSKELNEITNQLPDNKTVCSEILKQLKNENVVIETSEDKSNKVSFYIVATNHIIIANIKDTFTRIQTIAHECIHSTQNRKTLLFNFIFSNIYILYFLVVAILTLLHIIKNPMIQVVILLMMGFIYYIVRSYLETDAMVRAPYVAKDYMINSKILSEKQIEEIMENYEVMNKMGIPMTNLNIIISVIVKIMIYCVISMIVI